MPEFFYVVVNMMMRAGFSINTIGILGLIYLFKGMNDKLNQILKNDLPHLQDELIELRIAFMEHLRDHSK